MTVQSYSDLTPKWQGPYKVILLTPTSTKLKEITPWVHIIWLKKVNQPSDENGCQTYLSSFSHRPYNSKVLIASTGLNWWWMGLSVSRLQLFLEQLLTEIWVSSPQGSMLEHIEDYISTLCLQEMFYNFYLFKIQFFSIVIYLILTSPNVV